ncbi:class I SAM-dependent methyltransferase [Streptomyces sp. NPDC101227]|uniref:class I SAM-dependent methyltransferase n=1 Tax=Streptomyces sp. NPDC101227 TaxID=3366136 RepID=UPI003824B33E
MNGSEPGEAGVRGAFDAVVRAYVRVRPEATVVALGEGLGTGFWRLDNGRLNWLTVQPPETAAVRWMLLPDGPRRRTLARAAGDHSWLDAVRDPDLGVIVTAPGVLTRLSPAAVRALLAACAERFPDGALVFDAPPRLKGVGGTPVRRVAALARRGAAWSGVRSPGPLRWGLDRAQLPRVASAHPGIVAVREVPVRRGRFGRLPAPLVCEVRFADARSRHRAASART